MAVRGSEKHATHLREARGCTHIFAEDARVQVERAAFGEEIERRRPERSRHRPVLAGATTSRALVPAFVEAGVIVVDMSDAALVRGPTAFR